MNEQIFKQEIRVMKILYISFILRSVIFGLTMIYLQKFSTQEFSANNITFQSIAILGMLISIPLSLKLYQTKTAVKNIPTGVSSDAKLIYIKQWFSIRLFILQMAICLNIIIYTIAPTTSLLICIGITLLCMIVFCRVNEDEIKRVIKESDNIENSKF